MAFGRRTFRVRRRFTSGSKKTFKRKRNVTRKTRMLRRFKGGNYHRFTRYSGYTYGRLDNQCPIGNYSVGGETNPSIAPYNSICTNRSPAFTLTDCDATMLGTTEFANLFDEYRIRSAVVEISGNQNGGYPNDALAGTQLKGAVRVRWVYDHNDNTTTNMNTDIWWAQRAPLVKEAVLTGNRIIRIPVRPTPISLVTVTSTTTGASTIKKGQWLNTEQANIPHYGLKFQVWCPGDNSAQATDAVPPFFYRIKYNLEFKGPK